MMFTEVETEIWGCRFAPCTADRLLLKTVLAKVKQAVAQKVLLFSRRFEMRLVLSGPHCNSLKLKLMNMNNLKRREAFRGEISRRETQQPNLITKGRN
ncbi:MAG TPA: hypothetical protein VMA13_00050 [Candidatus Saccharimonadales bacterium]|nr:hypothetical protein [Candidatus Saccharimonadales bacterium]